jgi:hypothetical protein
MARGAGGHRLTHVDLRERVGFHHNEGLAMRLAITAGNVSLMASATWPGQPAG